MACRPKSWPSEAGRRRLDVVWCHGHKVICSNGCFDILHAGHLTSLGGGQAVGRLPDRGPEFRRLGPRPEGDSRPVISQRHHGSQLVGLACVDMVVLFDDPTPEALIELVEPDILVKRGDYSIDRITGADFMRRRGVVSSLYHWYQA